MKLDFESAEAGTPLESISIPALNRVGLARYAGAVDDFGAVHLGRQGSQSGGQGLRLCARNPRDGVFGACCSGLA